MRCLGPYDTLPKKYLNRTIPYNISIYNFKVRYQKVKCKIMTKFWGLQNYYSKTKRFHPIFYKNHLYPYTYPFIISKLENFRIILQNNEIECQNILRTANLKLREN